MKQENNMMRETKEKIDKLLPEIADACMRDHVALIDGDSLKIIGDYLERISCARLLEIGSGYGYSALAFLLLILEQRGDLAHITTIERLQSRWERANDFFTRAGVTSQICSILGEAPEAFAYLDPAEKWDCIFVDAAMGRYGDFWLQMKDSLSPNGIFIADNVNLHGILDKNSEELPRRHRTMEKRMKAFLQMLEEEEDWQYQRYDYGEGLLVIERRREEK